MIFIIDENVSPDAVSIFQDQGLEAYHINQLKSHSEQRVIDDQIRRLSIRKGYVIVTKDDDFVHSYVDKKVPNKLIFLYGLNTKPKVIARLNQVVDKLEEWLTHHDFIEVRPEEVRFPFS